MSLGRNPYVQKAVAAEQKAASAPDDASRVRVLRDAAHQWERAADREAPGKRREEYAANAARNRRVADGDVADDGEPEAVPVPELDFKLLN